MVWIPHISLPDLVNLNLWSLHYEVPDTSQIKNWGYRWVSGTNQKIFFGTDGYLRPAKFSTMPTSCWNEILKSSIKLPTSSLTCLCSTFNYFLRILRYLKSWFTKDLLACRRIFYLFRITRYFGNVAFW